MSTDALAPADVPPAAAIPQDHIRALTELGHRHYRQKRFEDAAACFARAIALQPDNPSFHHTLGATLGNLSHLKEAEVCFRRALNLSPDNPEALANLGHVLREQDRFEEAARCFARAIVLQPSRPDVHNALGVVFSNLTRHKEAEVCFRRALNLNPNHTEALTNLGIKLRQRDGFVEAEALHRRALAVAPDFADAWWHLGVTLREQGRLVEALDCYRRAIAIAPDHRDANLSLGLALLAVGDIPAGSAAYEARYGMGAKRRYPVQNGPLWVWDGRPLPGRTLLLLGEQGLGDVIQFVRYAKLVRPLVGRLVMRCHPSLRDLVARIPEFDEVIPDTAALPAFDAFIPLLSVMHALGTTLDTVPAEVPYLTADPGRTAALAPRFPAEGLKVGIVWAGSTQHLGDARRSLPLTALAPILDMPDVRFVSLQVGARSAELRESPWAERVLDLTSELGNFADTAAALHHLDLVISIDTSVVHLAGALGRPAWVLLPLNADWRWLRDRTDSPWYPSLRLYRQDEVLQWAPVIERVRRDLRTLAAGAPRPGVENSRI